MDQCATGYYPVPRSLNIETEYRPGEDVIEGWGILLHDGLSGTKGIVGGHVVLRRGDFKTIVPIASINEKVTLLPFDNTEGSQT